MRHVDFAPLYRSTVGFDRLFSLLDSQTLADNGQTYPPYNIERTGENAYRVTLAVAGFGDEELSIEARENVLTVKGEKAESQESDQYETLYRGIAGRAFERRFQLDTRKNPPLSAVLPRGSSGARVWRRPWSDPRCSHDVSARF